jgi:hypothetical protein
VKAAIVHLNLIQIIRVGWGKKVGKILKTGTVKVTKLPARFSLLWRVQQHHTAQSFFLTN